MRCAVYTNMLLCMCIIYTNTFVTANATCKHIYSPIRLYILFRWPVRRRERENFWKKFIGNIDAGIYLVSDKYSLICAERITQYILVNIY